MNRVPVQIEFLSQGAGGRSAPPTGTRYACTAVFATPGGSVEEWSVVLYLAESPPRLRFLVDSAPAHLLAPGRRLELHEGPRTVAFATVLPTKAVAIELLTARHQVFSAHLVHGQAAPRPSAQIDTRADRMSVDTRVSREPMTFTASGH